LGDPLTLNVDGLVQTTNENVDELPLEILNRTGQSYKERVWKEVRSIRTGEARVAPTHPKLPCRHLVLTVAPKFTSKYKSAAESALYSCYNSILEVSF